ncbi:hypothetical protein QJQ45_016045, partial [Haematococcus lacustris]
PESQMEPGGPLPPQPPELTVRYNKKLLTLEEISQAHASSVYAQKYSIEVVGGKIKAVCNDCKVVLSCGNLSDSRKHQCNKDLLQVQQPGMAHPPGQVQQPGMAHPPGQVQQPGMAHPPGQVQQPGMAHPPGQVQQPGMAHPPGQVQQPGMAHPPGQVQQPGMAHPPGQVQQLTTTYGAAMAELLSHASRLLGVHATSAASERNWSAWGRLFTSARTRLTLERAKMLIYIKANAGLGARRSNEAQLLARMGE